MLTAGFPNRKPSLKRLAGLITFTNLSQSAATVFSVTNSLSAKSLQKVFNEVVRMLQPY